MRNNGKNFLCCLLVCAGCVFLSMNSPGATVSPASYRADQIIIQLKPGVAPSALAKVQIAPTRRIFQAGGGMHVVAVPAGESVASLIEKYRQSGLVTFAEPDYYVYANAVPKDPRFGDGSLWGLNNYGQSGGTPGADIHALAAWDVLTSASNIVVAVLDSGIRATHEDLAANMWSNSVDGGHGYNAFTGTNDPADDATSHGTMVAGILGAVGNNGKGVTGVAWRVQMMACKCMNGGTGSDATIIDCVDYALAHGAKIINASFDTPTASLALSNAIVAARDAGVIWVASAGNNSQNIDITPSYPSCYGLDNIVSVAATTRNDGLFSLSNFGATNVALGAPGDQLTTTFAASDTYYYPPAGLGINIGGTSLAAPYVSGALALMLAKYPDENYRQIIQRLLAATDPVPALRGKCKTGGRLNLAKALNPPIVAVLAAQPGGTLLLNWTGGIAPFQVQSATNLTATPVAWETIGTASNGNTWLITPTNGMMFYRITGQ